MKNLPDNVSPYRRTPVFTDETMPAPLLKDHATGENIWGVIHVEEGRLEYTIADTETHILQPGDDGVIEPKILHHVKPLGKLAFYIEFYK